MKHDTTVSQSVVLGQAPWKRPQGWLQFRFPAGTSVLPSEYSGAGTQESTFLFFKNTCWVSSALKHKETISKCMFILIAPEQGRKGILLLFLQLPLPVYLVRFRPNAGNVEDLGTALRPQRKKWDRSEQQEGCELHLDYTLGRAHHSLCPGGSSFPCQLKLLRIRLHPG